MPDIQLDDTIAAIATPAGEGGLSVIRVSGKNAFIVAGHVFFPAKGRFEDFPSHTIHYGEIKNSGEIVDQALASIFRSPHSFTGEDTVEFSCHGGLIVTRKILGILIAKGARHAEPGEFTKRAFLNGKLDLAQAEAVLDLIKAKSEKSAQTAVSQLTGNLSRRFHTIKNELMKMYAHMEAFLDFPEEDLEVYEDGEFMKKFEWIGAELSALISSFQRGSLFREGVNVVLTGKPNVGKSSLFNCLLERDRALVSEHPGTTRDILEEAVEIGGIYMKLIDTAGLSDRSGHPVERMGMDKTKEILKSADVYLCLLDSSAALDEADRAVFREMDSEKPAVIVLNKGDLQEKLKLQEVETLTGKKDILKISTVTRQGIDDLEKKLFEIVLASAPEVPGGQITRQRHKNALESAKEAMARSQAAFTKRESLEFVIVDLKAALDSLRELIGEIYSEDLLDVIFSEFCIGK